MIAEKLREAARFEVRINRTISLPHQLVIFFEYTRDVSEISPYEQEVRNYMAGL